MADAPAPIDTLSLRPFREEQSSAAASYFIVIEEGSARTFPLPAAGEVVVGRDPEAGLALQDKSVSRRHALLQVAGDGVRLQDLDSRHGTRVNGLRVPLPRLLGTGDVVAVGKVTLVLCRAPRQVPGRPILQVEGPAGLRQRLEEEIDRALRYGRPVTLVCLQLGGHRGDAGAGEAAVLDRPLVAAALAGQLRLLDAAGWGEGEEGRLLVLLPELSPDEVAACVERLAQALSRVAPLVRAGSATCPSDGVDAEVLLAGASAAAACGQGALTTAAQAVTTLLAGEREICVADPAMLRIYGLLQKLARSDLPILLCGETGTGKEVAAGAVHAWSRRAAGPLVSLNCAALPESLIENELFGHERGAYSGAEGRRQGLLEAAHGGTLFLDEIGELPAQAQAKLLRVLETGRFLRLGDPRERAVDVRILAATNRDLEGEVAARRFRQDLLFRLGVARVQLVPLRDRPRDIPVLARHLLREVCARSGRPQMELSPLVMQRLLCHPWPGNVRELKHVIDYAVALLAAEPGVGIIDVWHLPAPLSGLPDGAPPPPPEEETAAAPPLGPPPRFRPIEEELGELERTRMAQALAAAGGVQRLAAELISMPLRTFVTRLRQYDLPVRRRRGD